ncbi:MAG TPA: DUF1700 domain-containing protein [Caulobacteraceae bacterium]|jgi:uncharacterized membrane protein|nr:DUF1700 domain-containing protein [Caulobacteraceae bacterium]
MIRDAFLARLREGLGGLPPAAVDDIVADYAAHFSEGAAAGRSEESVAQALGDPGRLARELRAEAGLRRWEEQRNPTAAAGAIFAVLGLGAIDLLILAPVLIAVGSALFGLFLGSLGVFVAGIGMFVAGLFNQIPGGGPSPAQAAFAGLGMMSGSVCAAALLSLAVIGLVNLLVRYGRLHYRLLQPAVRT